MVLRRLIFLMGFLQVSFLLQYALREALTITSPVFCEVVLQISNLPPIPSGRDPAPGFDFIFGEQFAERKDFKLIIKTCVPLEQETFQIYMKETFSLLAREGHVHFEMVGSIQNPVKVSWCQY